MSISPVRTALNVYVPSMPRLTPITLSRVHRRRGLISLSIREGQVFQEEQAEERAEEREEVGMNLFAVNWAEFWKRVKIYPEQVEYPDASGYVSLRHRSRTQERARERAREVAYVSDTDSESVCDDVIVV